VVKAIIVQQTEASGCRSGVRKASEEKKILSPHSFERRQAVYHTRVMDIPGRGCVQRVGTYTRAA